MLKRDQVIAALPAFKNSDLKAIKAVIDSLLGEGAITLAPTPKNAPDGPLGWLFDSLMTITAHHVSYGHFATTKAGKQFKKYAPGMLAFTEDAFPEALSKKVNGMAIFRLLLEQLIADLKLRGIPVTLGTITLNMDRTSIVFEQAFPGYLEAGLTTMIAARIKRQ